MPRYSLTALCFSLQKSLAPSLSSASHPVQEARTRGPLELVRGRLPVHSCTGAAPQSDMRATWVTLHPTISSRYLTHRSYSVLYMATSSRGQGFLLPLSLFYHHPHPCHSQHGRGPSLPIWMDNPQGTNAGPPRLCRRQIERFLHFKVCRLALPPRHVTSTVPTARALIHLGFHAHSGC